ncbi:MAG: peptidase M22 [Clostridiales bacterium]|nr:peptidase M22 [Clostridiales bacterium]
MTALGIDTSNYTTSAAVYNNLSGEVRQVKRMLPVKNGEKGLRQSDAVFLHTNQLHSVLSELLSGFDDIIDIVSVSARPRDAKGSYMPCFLVGLNTAKSICSVTGLPLKEYSHQSGHIAAAAYSSGCLDLLKSEFIAFHVSGGTTEMLYVKPVYGDKMPFEVKIIGSTLDLNFGQAVDRLGVKFGLPFPCGKEIEKSAFLSEKVFKPAVSVKDGNCSVSGLENKFKSMLDNGEKKEDVARFCLDYISHTLIKMTAFAHKNYGDLPVLFAGGVMSNKIIQAAVKEKFPLALFAQPDLSCDNAVGMALLPFVGK